MFGIRQISYFPNTHRTHTNRDRSGHFPGFPRFSGHFLDVPAICMDCRPFSWIPKLSRISGPFSQISNHFARFPNDFLDFQLFNEFPGDLPKFFKCVAFLLSFWVTCHISVYLDFQPFCWSSGRFSRFSGPFSRFPSHLTNLLESSRNLSNSEQIWYISVKFLGNLSNLQEISQISGKLVTFLLNFQEICQISKKFVKFLKNFLHVY